MKILNLIKLLITLVGLLVSSNVNAQISSLPEALTAAYETNPELQQQRARLRISDEGYIQAKAHFAPTVSIQAQPNFDRNYLGRDVLQAQRNAGISPKKFNEQYSIQTQLVISQPLYTNGRLEAELQASKFQVLAGRQALRTTEANVLFQVFSVYADVLRDQEQIQIRNLNLKTLERQLEEVRARIDAGELTRTDEATSLSQLNSAKADMLRANTQLEISKTNFKAVVGQEPSTLVEMPSFVGIPTDFEKVMQIADLQNPDLAQANFQQETSRSKVYSARAENGLNVTAQIQSGYSGNLKPFDSRNLSQNTSVTLNFVVPLYSAGISKSITRQAYAQNAVDRENVEIVRNQMTKILSSAWLQRKSLEQQIELYRQQIEASTIALEGMSLEYTAGERSTIDVLVAEQTLRDAQINLSSARHDSYLNDALLIQNMGLLEIKNFAVLNNYYDPAKYLNTNSPNYKTPWINIIRKIDGIMAKKAKQKDR